MSRSSSSFRMASGKHRCKMAKKATFTSGINIYIKHVKSVFFYKHNCTREDSVFQQYTKNKTIGCLLKVDMPLKQKVVYIKQLSVACTV